jgi:nicotinamide-nucleotide amidase
LRTALLAVGDELLAGDVQDGNSAWLAAAVRARGHRVVSMEVVGDGAPAVAAAVTRARAAAHVLLVTGGLGPTADDLTRDGVAAAFGVALEERPGLLAELSAWAARAGRASAMLSPGSRRQAALPAGALALPNPYGTAPGFLLRRGAFLLAALPGVPTEMRAMARALLDTHLPPGPALGSRRLLACGPTESAAGELLADLMDHDKPARDALRVGLTARHGLLTISLRGNDAAALERTEAEVRARLGDALVGSGDDTPASVVVAGLSARGLTVTTAESCTGGLLAGAITSVPGSSAVFPEGVVTYSDEAKTARLGVPAAMLAEHGAVSEAVARAMAEAQRERAAADVALAVSGIAGPDGGTPDKPVGMIVVALADRSGSSARTWSWKGTREELRARTVVVALERLRRWLAALLVPLLLLPPAALLPACGRTEPPPARPNVLVWLVDTLRADHLGCYGYERPTSPHLDALARDGVLFEEAHVHSNWTQPSVASLLTGRHPLPYSEDFRSSVPEAFTLAAEWFARHGYATAGFTVTVATAARYGFAQGFETYEELDLLLDGRARKHRAATVYDGEGLVEAALGWLDARGGGGTAQGTPRRARDERPWLLFLHSVDPHAPYRRHDGMPSFTRPYDGAADGSVEFLAEAQRTGHVYSAEERRHLVDLYDDDVRYSDACLGALVEGLRARRLLDGTLLVVVSDHGEEFWDHDGPQPGHGHRNLHRELTHVPLVLHLPGLLPRGARIPDLMRGIDVLPTLLDLVGLPPLPDADGESVDEAVRAGRPLRRSVERATLYADRAKPRSAPFRALRTPHFLLEVNGEARDGDPGDGDPGDGEEPALLTLWDVKADPRELSPLRDAVTDEMAARLATLVDAWVAEQEALVSRLGERDLAPADDVDRERLEALGYLGDDGR